MAGQTKAATAAQRRSQGRTKDSQREQAAESKIVVDGKAYRLGDLELGELEELEAHTGLPMDEISYGSAKVIAFIVYLVRRRDDPNYTLDDARKIKIMQVHGDDKDSTKHVAAGADDPPTGASNG